MSWDQPRLASRRILYNSGENNGESISGKGQDCVCDGKDHDFSRIGQSMLHHKEGEMLKRTLIINLMICP